MRLGGWPRSEPDACIAALAGFAPPWAEELRSAGWAEVEHRAFGFALGGTPLDAELLRRGQRGPAAAAAANAAANAANAAAANAAAAVAGSGSGGAAPPRQPPPQRCARRKAGGGLRCRAVDRPGDWGPRSASEVLDGGAAGMWYTYRRGSGVFFRMGRAAVGVGKLQAP